MSVIVSPPHRIAWNGGSARCVLGRGGVRADKREGDGATPAGRFPLRRVLYRPDRGPEPVSALPVAAITPSMGWCDDPLAAAYNQPVTRPCASRCEALWRDDGVYDLLIVVGYNDQPVRPGLGSAIFIHLAKPDWALTEGCVALAEADLRALIAALAPGDRLTVDPLPAAG